MGSVLCRRLLVWQGATPQDHQAPATSTSMRYQVCTHEQDVNITDGLCHDAGCDRHHHVPGGPAPHGMVHAAQLE